MRLQHMPPYLPINPQLQQYTVGVDDGGKDPRLALHGQLGLRVRSGQPRQPLRGNFVTGGGGGTNNKQLAAARRVGLEEDSDGEAAGQGEAQEQAAVTIGGQQQAQRQGQGQGQGQRQGQGQGQVQGPAQAKCKVTGRKLRRHMHPEAGGPGVCFGRLLGVYQGRHIFHCSLPGYIAHLPSWFRPSAPEGYPDEVMRDPVVSGPSRRGTPAQDMLCFLCREPHLESALSLSLMEV